MEDLFLPHEKSIGLAVLSDDVINFKKYYQKNLTIDNQKLLMFCADNSAYAIIIENLNSNPQDFRKLNLEEKKLWSNNLLKDNTFYKQTEVDTIFKILYENFKLSHVLVQDFLLKMIKYKRFYLADLYFQKLKCNHAFVRNFLLTINECSIEVAKYSLTPFYKIIKEYKSPSHVFNKLCLSVNFVEEYSFAKELINFIEDKDREDILHHCFKSNNLNYYFHSFSINMKKSDISNIDINIDFLNFFIYLLLLTTHKIEDLYQEKLKKLLLVLKKEDYIDFSEEIRDIENLMLNIKLEKSLKITRNMNKKVHRGKI